MTGTIFNIVRSSFNDGSGVRTVVYLKGCNLRCKWCHNPEGLEPGDQWLYYPHLCIGCGRCVAACPTDALSIQDGIRIMDAEKCKKCFTCVDACPVKAQVRYGTRYTPEEILSIVKRDFPFFRASGGGVTFSGGECLLQWAFLKECLTLCRENGIHTAIETALFVPWDRIEPIYPLVDQLIADCKAVTPELHRWGTGAHGTLIRENLTKLSQLHPNIRIRTPLIPGFNDTTEELVKIVDFINTLGSGVQEYEPLRYNNLADSKYDALGESRYQHNGTDAQPQSPETIRQILSSIRPHLRPEIRLLDPFEAER